MAQFFETLEEYEQDLDREYDLEDAALEGRGLEEAEHLENEQPAHLHHVHVDHHIKLVPQPSGAPPTTNGVEHPIDKPDVPDKAAKKQKKRLRRVRKYASKFKGNVDNRMKIPPLIELWWSWVGSFLSIGAVWGLTQLTLDETNIPFVVGSFGASAVLLFALSESKLSQPRAFMGGHFVSALTGIIVRNIIHQPWIAGPVGMSFALTVMQLTCTSHPPGGATALIVCSMTTLPKWSGFSYLITILTGTAIMQVIALLLNNLSPHRVYPTYWW